MTTDVTGLVFATQNAQGIALAKAEALVLHAAANNTNYVGLASTHKFLDVGGKYLTGASIVSAGYESYANGETTVETLNAMTNAGAIESISLGAGVGAAFLTAGNPVVFVLVSTLTNVALTTLDYDFVGVDSNGQDLTTTYTNGAYTYKEIYDPSAQTISYTTENSSIPGIENNATVLHLNNQGTVTGLTRYEDASITDINFADGTWSYQADAVSAPYEGTLDQDPTTIPTQVLADLNAKLDNFNAEFQQIDPNFDIRNTGAGALVEAGNVTGATIGTTSVIFANNTEIYFDSATNVSVFTHDNVRFEQNQSTGEIVIGVHNAQTSFTDYLVYNGDGSQTLITSDGLGQVSQKTFTAFSELTASELHDYTYILAAGIKAQLDGGMELLSQHPELAGDLNVLFGTGQATDDLQALLDRAEENPSDDIHEITSGPSVDSADGSVTYQAQALEAGPLFGPIQLTDEELVLLAQNGADEFADLRISAFWELHARAVANGVVSTNASGNTQYDLPSGAYLETVNTGDPSKTVELIKLQGVAKPIGVVTKYEGTFQQQVVEVLDSDTNSVVVDITTSNETLNQAFSGGTITLKYPDTFVFSEVGGYIGNVIGQQLADGDIYRSVLYSSALKTLGENSGVVLDFVANGTETLDSVFAGIFGSDTNTAETGVQALPDLFEGFVKNLQLGITSSVGSLIASELGESLEIGGIGGEVFNVVANTVTTGVVNEVFGMVFNGMDGGVYTGLLSGGFDFSIPFYDSSLPGGGFPTLPDGTPLAGPPLPNTTVGDFVQLQVINALAGFAGARLAGELIAPEDETAALFGAAGGALGTYIATTSAALGSNLAGLQVALQLGTAFGPVGIAVAVFLGTVFGTALGNVLADEEHPSSWGMLTYNIHTKEYYMSDNTQNDGGGLQIGADLASALAGGINSIIAATHGNLRSGSGTEGITIGWKEGNFLVIEDTGNTKEFDNSGEAIAYAAFKMLKGYDLVGGHAVIMRAWHNSDAQNLQEFKEDLEVAEAFMEYLQNPTGILALMMDQPDSDLAQAWAAILQRAAALELHLPHENDLDGGWNEVLIANGIDPESLANIEETTLTVTDPITGEKTIFHHLIGPGYEMVRIEGTDGNDIINVTIDGASIVYVDAGSGDDIINGSNERDVIFGGAGDDIINGNDGDDWLNGGAGNDTINGNNGLDLIVGGNDNDILIGGDNGDYIYGGYGVDILTGGSGVDYLYGGYGNDTLYGNDDSDIDYLYGGAGDDTLYGIRDLLNGGEGDDSLIWSSTQDGDTSVKVSRGDGHDTIEIASQFGNYISFDESISMNELWFHYDPNDSNNLIISIIGEDQSIKIIDYKNHGIHVEVLDYFYMDIKDLDSSSYAPLLNIQPTGQYNEISDANLTAMSQALGEGSWVKHYSHDRFLHDLDTGLVHLTKNLTMNYADVQDFVSYPANYPQYFSYHAQISNAYISNSFFHKGNDSVNTISAYYASGGVGNDILRAPIVEGDNTENVHFFGDSGDDIIYGGDHYLEGYINDKLVGGMGNDYIYADSGNDHVWGGLGNDELHGQGGNDTLWGGIGVDIIYGNNDNDVIHGGEGDDFLYGDNIPGNVSDLGNDVVNGDAGNDIIYGGGGEDTLDGGADNDTIFGGDDDDVIFGGTGNDTLDGQNGNDVLTGDSGDDILFGGTDDDRLSGGTGNDVLSGGTGNDVVGGGEGDDIYNYLGGNDIVIEIGTGLDTIVFDSIWSPSDVLLNGNTITFSPDDSITFNDITLIETFSFNGFAEMSLTELHIQVNIVPVAVDDVAIVNEGEIVTINVLSNDTDANGDTLTVSINTVAGNGSLVLNNNNTITYTPNVGYNGVDSFTYTINDGYGGVSTATVNIPVNNVPIAQDDTLVGVEDVILTGNLLADNGNGVDSDPNGDALTVTAESIVTAQGATVSILSNGDFTYTAPDDFNGTDVFNYTLSDDQGGVTIGTANLTISMDEYFGTSGNDIIYGDASGDIIYDSEGWDYIYGGDGDDIIYGTAGSDRDDIFGGNGNDTLYGSNWDLLTGGKGDDHYYLSTTQNYYTLVYINRDDGHDIIESDGNYRPEVRFIDSFGIEDLWFSYDPNNADDIIISVLGENQTVTVKDWATSQVRVTVMNDMSFDLADLVYAYGDRLNIQPQGDYNFVSANDWGTGTPWHTYWAKRTNKVYEVYKLGTVGDDTITATHSEYNTYILGFNGNDTINGYIKNDRLNGGLGDDDIFGDAGNDYLWGAAGNDTLGGGGGNDILYGGAGNDYLTGHNNDDIMYGGAGDDIISDGHGHNILHGGEGNDILTSDDENDVLIDELYGDEGNDYLRAGSSDDILDGGSGDDEIYGQGGNDTLTGGTGNDVLSGGTGNDIVDGGEGDDTYHYLGGHDIVIEIGTGLDTIIFDSIWSPSDVLLNGNTITFSPDDSVTFNDITLIETFSFNGFADMSLTEFRIQVNIVPVAVDDVAIVNEGEIVTIDVLSNDTDANGDALTVSINTVTVNGSLVLNSNNTITYTPNAGYNGIDSFTYTINDGYGGISTATVNITDINVPIAQGDTLVGAEDVILTGNLLIDNGNGVDSNPNGDALTVTAESITTAQGATVAIFSNGDFTYTALSDFNGTDVFNYTLNDAQGGGSVGTANVTINMDQYIGTSGNDTIYGDKSADLIQGGTGKDYIYGGDGDDILYGHESTDRDEIFGGNGNDTIYGYSWDLLTGGKGDDHYILTTTEDWRTFVYINRGDGDDVMEFDTSYEFGIRFDVTFGIDDLWFSYDPNNSNNFMISVVGEDQSILIKDYAGKNIRLEIMGSTSATINDIILVYGNMLNTQPTGEFNYIPQSAWPDAANTPWRAAWSGSSTGHFQGTQFDDSIAWGSIMHGYGGDDYIEGSSSTNDYLVGGMGNDTLVGKSLNDTLYGGYGNDFLYGYNHDDIMYGGAGDDYIADGNGYNILDGGAGNDTLLSDDIGDTKSDQFYGGSGDDSILAGVSDDILSGGTGNDVITGGGGADRFVFEAEVVGDGVDTITDFNVSDGDMLDISDILLGYDPLTDTISDFIQITDNGTDSTLSIDANGGADNFVQIAVLLGVTGLTDEDALETSGNLIGA
ncbi:MAG: hypothetical protein COA45_04205 [Zetaproteobacteria bacterium]|nr:MAG: hypothetical protein COA45_04205 [Zetaproteobacteria bacterium]